MRGLAAQGKSVVFRSTELAELVNVCDRIYVIRDGKSVSEVAGVGEEELLSIINSG
jgi:ABC-type sugar transport system ATPase subunit